MGLNELSESALEIPYPSNISTTELTTLLKSSILNHVQTNSWVNWTPFQTPVLLSIKELVHLLQEHMMIPGDQPSHNLLWNTSRG